MDILRTVSVVSLAIAVLCSAIILIDIVTGRWQKMWIMDVVWPLTALYAGPLGLWVYFSIGRANRMQRVDEKGRVERPFWQSVGLGATHCGSGCTLGDLVAESFLILVPMTLFGHEIFAAWVLDYIVAFLFGIAFQYFTIQPMRHLSVWNGVKAALKADTLSLTAWQVGMYGWMAIATFLIFQHKLPKTGPVFWFMMQIAMLAGFVTAYPVNWWLIRTGIKERM